MSAEVPRVYVGSFWNAARFHDENRRLFESEQNALFHDIQRLPRTSTLRKLNDFVARAHTAIAHAYVMGVCKTLWRGGALTVDRENKRRQIIKDLPAIYERIVEEYNIPKGDLPEQKHLRYMLEKYDFNKMHTVNKKMVETVQRMMALDVPRLMTMLNELRNKEEADEVRITVHGGAFDVRFFIGCR